jgi:uncharacterized protein YjbI with pentapeptide repeats
MNTNNKQNDQNQINKTSKILEPIKKYQNIVYWIIALFIALGIGIFLGNQGLISILDAFKKNSSLLLVGITITFVLIVILYAKEKKITRLVSQYFMSQFKSVAVPLLDGVGNMSSGNSDKAIEKLSEAAKGYIEWETKKFLFLFVIVSIPALISAYFFGLNTILVSNQNNLISNQNTLIKQENRQYKLNMLTDNLDNIRTTLRSPPNEREASKFSLIEEWRELIKEIEELRGVPLPSNQSTLTGLDFSYENTQDFSFSDESLSHSNFNLSCLYNISFENTNLSNSDFNSYIYSNTKVSEEVIEAGMTYLEGALFSEVTLYNTSFNGTIFLDCIFDTIYTNNTHFIDAEFINCKFNKAYFDLCLFQYATFIQVDFSEMQVTQCKNCFENAIVINPVNLSSKDSIQMKENGAIFINPSELSNYSIPSKLRTAEDSSKIENIIRANIWVDKKSLYAKENPYLTEKIVSQVKKKLFYK